MNIKQTQALLKNLNPAEIAELDELVSGSIWLPLPGPQMDAYYCEADELFYGGAAGGGKSDLLIGLALTSHRKSIIFRRESPQLQGILDRLHGEILRTRQGYNGQEKIQRLGHGRQLEFGSCPHIGDEQRYQGRPHDLICVEKGTLIRMEGGNYKEIERVRAGDMVETLEGPKKVTRSMYNGAKESVRADAFVGGDLIGSQVQSSSHSLLTTEGWASHDNACGSPLYEQAFSQPTARRAFYNTYEYLLVLRQAFSYISLLSQLDRKRTQKFSLSFLHQLRQAFSFGVASVDRGNCFGGSACRLLRASQRLISTSLRGLLPPFALLGASGSRDLTCGHDTPYGRAESSLEGFREHCLSYIHQYGGQPLQKQVSAILCPRLQAGAGVQSPIGFAGGDQEGTPKHSRYMSWYDHPYTMGKRRILADTLISSIVYTPVGKREMYDITVDSVNHYISGETGFVNKNCFDEITHFLPLQYNFLRGWLRSTYPDQRCRIVAAGNPPTDSDGEWVIHHWGPWLEPDHPDPAAPGELRWYAMVDGKEEECTDGDEFEYEGETINPQSRTFIPSSVEDNPFLMATGYKAQLQSLPEPLRSQMLKGDFMAGLGDDPWQVIPTAWVRQAQARWKPGKESDRMDSIGVDVARGGSNQTVISRRHGNWFAELLEYPGTTTPNGPAVASLVFAAMRNSSPVHIDVIGVGASVYDHVAGNNIQCVGINGAEKPVDERDKTSRLKFRNRRAELYWRMREALDPQYGEQIELPPSPKLKADLCSARWKLTVQGVQIESKEDVIKRIGRSPDCGDAVVYALVQTMPYYHNDRDAMPDYVEDY